MCITVWRGSDAQVVAGLDEAYIACGTFACGGCALIGAVGHREMANIVLQSVGEVAFVALTNAALVVILAVADGEVALVMSKRL